MAPQSFSHQSLSPEPGANHGESALDCKVRLEAEGATLPTKSSPSPQRETTHIFLNGWFSKQCGHVTEHRKLKGRQICLECGYKMGPLQINPDVKAKKREYFQRPDVKAKKREKRRQRRIEKLETKLQAIKMEASQ